MSSNDTSFSNAEIARSLNRIEDTTTAAKKELEETRLDVRGLSTRLDTWQETKCLVHDAELKELHVDVIAAKTLATAAAFKAAAMYTAGLAAVGGIVTWAIKATIGT